VNDEFETAVAETLADLAKVDRSTSWQVRASISLLPDRRSSRLSRIGRSTSIWPDRRRPFAVAAALVIVVAVAGFSLLGRFSTQPNGPASPVPLGSSPVGTATPPPSAGPTPNSTWQPQAFTETLPVVFTGEQMAIIGWSPDGSHFAILEHPSGSGLLPPVSVVHIFDRAGSEVGSVIADEFAWTGPESYVVLRYVPAPGRADSTTEGDAYLGSIGSTELQRFVGNYDNILGGPSGAVALIQPWAGTITPQPSYVVVSAGGVSAQRSGYPAAWSRDGGMLAVLHATTAPMGFAGLPPGWLEVVRSTGESVASGRQVASAAAQVAFSPDGSRVAFRDETDGAGGGGSGAFVLETASGHLANIPKSGAFTWASNDELLLAYRANGFADPTDRILAWSASTGRLTDYGPGNIVGASGDGTVISGFDGTLGLAWTTRSASNAASGTVLLGDSPWMGVPDAAWSPDGASLILIAGDARSSTMDAVLFRP
jgi:hypothetical protein